MKKYIVRLNAEEEKQLKELTKTGKTAAYKIRHANILLAVDANGANRKDEEVAKIFGCHEGTVRNIRQRFVEEGLELAISNKSPAEPRRERILDGRKEARLIALSCCKSPRGQGRWTMQMLADKLVALKIVKTISSETVRTTLKKTK